MKTTIKATNSKAKKEVIEEGLKKNIMKKNREALISELGSYDLDLSLEKLEEMRKD